MKYEINDGCEIPLGKRRQCLNLAIQIYAGGGVNKSVAAKLAIEKLGLGDFSSIETGVDYIRHKLK